MFDPTYHPGDSVLNEYLDGELDAAGQAALEAHLAGCGDCTRRLAQLEALFLALERFPDEVPSHDLAGAVQYGLEKTSSNPRQRLILTLGTAAQLLLAAAALIWLVPGAVWDSLASGWAGVFRAPDLQSALHWLTSAMDAGAQRSIPQVLTGFWPGWMSGIAQAWAAGQAGLAQAARSLTQAGLGQVSILEWSLFGLAMTLIWLAGNGILIGSLNRKSRRRNS